MADRKSSRRIARNRRRRPRVQRSVRWLQAGVAAAGLGAAISAGSAVASAATATDGSAATAQRAEEGSTSVPASPAVKLHSADPPTSTAKVQHSQAKAKSAVAIENSTNGKLKWVAAKATAEATPAAKVAVLSPSVAVTPLVATAASAKNSKPTVAPQVGTEDPETGVITGQLNASDASKHALVYKIVSGGQDGVTTVDNNGVFTYTPDHSWAHAGGGTDSITVEVSDKPGSPGAFSSGPNTTTTTIPLTVTATNYAPTLTVTQVGQPDAVGAIGYDVATSDADGDAVTDVLGALPTHGTVAAGTTTSLVYTPNAAYAHSLGVGGIGSDSFTVEAMDGHGGVTGETVTTAVAFHNSAPVSTRAPQVSLNTDGTSTVTTSFVDADGDVMTYTVTPPAKGTVVNNGDGTFTYTPTAAARIQAGATGATAADRIDTFAVTAGDGYTQGAPLSVTVDVTAPYWAQTQVNVQTGPSDVAFNSDGTRAYVTNQYDHSVSVIDTATKQDIDPSIQVGADPVAVTVRPGGDVYVANSQGNTVSVINPVSNTVVAVIPVGTTPGALALTTDGSELFVANENADSISVIDTGSNTVSGFPIPTGSGPSGLVVSPSGSNPLGDTLFVTNYNDNDVSAFDIVGRVNRGNVATGTSPLGVAYSPITRRLYVTNSMDSSVLVMDVQDSNRWTIPVGGGPVDVAVSPLGTYAYVANMGNHRVDVISMASNQVIDVIDLGAGAEPSAVAVSPDGSAVYVTLSESNSVVILTVPAGFE